MSLVATRLQSKSCSQTDCGLGTKQVTTRLGEHKATIDGHVYAFVFIFSLENLRLVTIVHVDHLSAPQITARTKVRTFEGLIRWLTDVGMLILNH